MADVAIWQGGALYQPGDLTRASNSGVITQPVINNGDMELGNSGWTFTGDGNGTIDATAPIFEGGFSMKSNDTGGNNQKVATNNARLDVTPGQIVTLTCYVRCTGDPDRTRVQSRINWYAAGDVLLAPTELAADPSIIGAGFVRILPGLTNSGGLVGLAASGVWVQLEVTGTAPPTAVKWTAAIAFNWGPDGAWAADRFTAAYANTAVANLLLFRAIQAASGFSGNIEPVWPVILGGTVVDNQVTWQAVSGNSVTWQASRVLVSSAVEPAWPVIVGASVPDNTMQWTLDSRRIVDSHVPNNSEVVLIASKKVFIADNDIVDYSATVNPLDFSTKDDAGYIPFGLNAYGGNPIRAMGLYRGNLAVFNSNGCQVWQLDEDPAGIAFLDGIPVSCTFPKSVQPVGDDLAFLSNLGIRSLGLSGANVNLQGGFFGQQVDPLVVLAIAEAALNTWDPIGLFWPARGQYWLFFGTQAFVLTIAATPGNNLSRSWSRYVFPSVVTDWTLQGTDLVLRSGNLVWAVDPTALLDDTVNQTSTFQTNLDSATQYATAGWTAATTAITLPANVTHPNATPAQLWGPPRPASVMVVVANSGTGGQTTHAVSTSLDNGATWTGRTTAIGQFFIGVASSATRSELLLLSTGGVMARSTDGITFTPLVNNIGGGNWQDLARSDALGLYIACGQDGVDAAHRVATSPDGVTWTRRTITSRNWARVVVAPYTGHILVGSTNSSNVGMAYSVDGITYTDVAGLGVGWNTSADEMAQGADGLYVVATRGDLRIAFGSNLAGIFGNTVTPFSQVSLAYSANLNLFAAGTPNDGIYTAPAAGNVWTKRSTPANIHFDFVEAMVGVSFGGFMGVRPVNGSETLTRIVRSINGTVWSEISPAALQPTSIYIRIHEAQFVSSAGGAINTPFFTDATLTGLKGTLGPVANHACVGEIGDSVIIKYPAEGPFVPVSGNHVGSRRLSIAGDVGLVKYLDEQTVLRITHATGVDYNYLGKAVLAGDTELPLALPLEHVATAIRAFPIRSILLNSTLIEFAYVSVLLTVKLQTANLVIGQALPADATNLPFIVRPYQATTVAGGQGTTALVIGNVTTFDNGAAAIPEAGFPAAPIVIGSLLTYDAGINFTGVLQWPYIDLGLAGRDKELQGFDLVIDGVATVSFGYNQREADYNVAGSWTTPFEVNSDTLPDAPVPFTMSGPSFAMRLEFSPNQQWEWHAANLYVDDKR